MDSGTDTETKEEVAQPVDSVVDDAEVAEAKPQAEDIEQEELYVEEEEGDQEKPNNTMTPEQTKAAWIKEKNKRKDKQKQIEAEKAEKELLAKRVAELEAKVNAEAKGKPPTLEDCDYDEEAYQEKVREYYSKSAPNKEEATNQEPQGYNTDEAEFYLYQSEQELAKKLPSYAESKDKLVNSLGDAGVQDPNAAMVLLSEVARQKGVDIAKSFVAMEKNPSIILELQKAGTNYILMGDILEKAANKVKTRAKKPIDTQPEPEINSTGSIDSGSVTVNKLRQAWIANPNTKNYNAYQKAKKAKVK